jgi:poly(3-hydroxybutyrate) depolymerase
MPTSIRNRRASLSALVAFALLLPSLAAAVLAPGDNDRTLTFAGNERTYRVHVPPGWTATARVPLVLDIHGWSTTAELQQSLSGMQAVSDREGFIVVWPQGIGNQWNAGVCCGNPGLDDVGFLRAVVDAVQAEGNTDPRRIYVTGLSNGGAMSHKLACEASDVFVAAAPMAFPLPYPELTDCQPAQPIPILMVMGLTDMLVEYEDGDFGSAPATFARWRDLHGCTGTPGLVPHGQGRCETFATAQCASGYEVSLCSIVAQAFPGQFFDGHILYVNSDLNLAEEAWRFLSQYRRGPALPVAPTTLSGRARLRVHGSGSSVETASWQLSIGPDSWVVLTDRDGALEGAGSTGSGRRRTLTLDAEARAALLAEIVARSEALTGQSGWQVAPLDAASFKVVLDSSGSPRQITGSVKLLRGDGSGQTAGRFAIRLRR